MNDISEFENELSRHGGTDIEIPYRDVARYFPSDQGHSESPEYKAIDTAALKAWCDEKGYSVSFLHEKAAIDAPNSPPLRFILKNA